MNKQEQFIPISDLLASKKNIDEKVLLLCKIQEIFIQDLRQCLIEKKQPHFITD